MDDFPEAPSLVPSEPRVETSEGSEGIGDPSVVADLLDSSIFELIQQVSTLVGAGVVVFLVFFIIRYITQGAVGMAVKTLIIGSVVSAMLFNLETPIRFATGLTRLVSNIADFMGGVVG